MAHYDMPTNSASEDSTGDRADNTADSAPSVEAVTTLHSRILDLAENEPNCQLPSDAIISQLLGQTVTATRAAVTELLAGLVHIDVHDKDGNLTMRYLAHTPDSATFPHIDDELDADNANGVVVDSDSGLPQRHVDRLTLGAVALDDLRLFATDAEHDANQLTNSLVGAPLSATSLISVDVFEYYVNRDAHTVRNARAIIHGYCESIDEFLCDDGSEWMIVRCRSACPITLYLPAAPWRDRLQRGMIIEGMFAVLVGLGEESVL